MLGNKIIIDSIKVVSRPVLAPKAAPRITILCLPTSRDIMLYLTGKYIFLKGCSQKRFIIMILLSKRISNLSFTQTHTKNEREECSMLSVKEE